MGHCSWAYHGLSDQLFAAGFFDTIHTWLQKKNRTSEQIAKFLLEMLVQLRS